MTGSATVVTALIGALNDMDAGAFARLLAEDVVVEHVPLGARSRARRPSSNGSPRWPG
jgi:hypothetical protein